ncbi:unnamed protein product [Periconia digitata]|uniref:Uncharacterized protein n=1 Tax=Periconia digitata TaxID=1303443 RepID=A0A9W4XFI2_9PLEO|nr:unnamed protein product [Periconia digitata]
MAKRAPTLAHGEREKASLCIKSFPVHDKYHQLSLVPVYLSTSAAVTFQSISKLGHS